MSETNNSSTEDNRPGYAIRPPTVMGVDALRPGDILLHYSPQWKSITKLIKAITKSPYTHALIYLGGGHIAEANILPPKVSKNSLEIATRKVAHIAVFRSQCGFASQRVQELNTFIDDLTKKTTRCPSPVSSGVVFAPRVE